MKPYIPKDIQKKISECENKRDLNKKRGFRTKEVTHFWTKEQYMQAQ